MFGILQSELDQQVDLILWSDKLSLQDGLCIAHSDSLLLLGKGCRNVIVGYRTKRACLIIEKPKLLNGLSTRPSLRFGQLKAIRCEKGHLFRKLSAIGHESLDKLRILSLSKDKKRVSSYDGHPFRIEWLPGTYQWQKFTATLFLEQSDRIKGHLK